jgi:phosphatidylserine/phosphatidylglycerophosphate/cardiolipin synthase-like enzyme
VTPNLAALQRKFRFPWRDGNRFELLVDGPTFFPRMLQCIESANRVVQLEFYLFESGAVADRFIEALTAAAARGVTVKVLLDDFGAFDLSKRDRGRLVAAGVALAFYNRLHYSRWLNNLFRNHRKLLLVDREWAFVGGAGITDAFDPPDPARHPWRETMVAVEGPVVRDWQALFAETWARMTGQDLAVEPNPTPLDLGVRGRIAATNTDIKRSVIARARRARTRVWIATAYFVPSWKLLRALRRAAVHGADVRLLLPGPLTDHPAVRHAGRRFYARLLRNGVRIFEYQPGVMHAKTALCDHWVSIGSSNLDGWNLRWNLEANQEVEDPAFAAQVREMFEGDFRESTEWHYATWARRPWHVRAREYVWGIVARWLT